MAQRLTTPRLLWVVLALLLWAHPAAAEVSASVESFTLANGLEVVVIPNHRLPAVSHMLWYRVGGGDDPSGKSGLAHFHEHVMFLGTAAHGPGEYDALISRHGGQQNAFTGYDATAYYIDISKDELPLAMALEADRMNPLTVSDAGVKREREVIMEERRARIENSPTALFSEQMNASLFRQHPYHTPVIGWMHEMKQLTRADVFRFHQIWYHPNNAVLVLSGDITAAEARPMVERYYGGLPRVPVPQRRWSDEPPQLAPRQIAMRHANVKQPVWSRIYAASSLGYGNKDQALPTLVLSQLLGVGKTSRLYRSLVTDKKLASSVDVGYDVFTIGPSRFEISIIPESGTDMETITKAVDEEIARSLKDGFSDKEMARAKTQLKADSVFTRDDLNGMARTMGWIRMVGLDKDYFLRWPQLIEAVTAESVSEAGKSALNLNQSVTGFLLPEEEKK